MESRGPIGNNHRVEGVCRWTPEGNLPDLTEAYNPPTPPQGRGHRGMSETNNEILEEEDEEFLGEIDLEEDEEAVLENGEVEAEPDEASLEEMLSKPEEAAGGEEEEESLLSLDTEERVEALSVRVEPKKDTEFVCQKCYLVKPIRSQLADKTRMYCRDCA
jgi:hypothetical protein